VTPIPARYQGHQMLGWDKGCGRGQRLHLALASGSVDQRVNHPKVCEALKIAICCPQFGHAVRQAQGCDAGIMNSGSQHGTAFHQPTKDAPVMRPLSQQHQTRGFQSAFHLLDGITKGSWGTVDAGMSHNGEKFVNTRPGNSPGDTSLDKLCEASIGGSMPWRILPMGAHQEVGIDSDHPLPGAGACHDDERHAYAPARHLVDV
jgi:hypothetical protein